MAYDKVVDSSVLDAGLKRIADAIREKSGLADNLAFPTAMVEAIAAIEAVGEEMAILSATATPTANSLNISFTGLAGEPALFSICPTANIALESTRYIIGLDYDGTKTFGFCGYTSGSMYSKTGHNAYSDADFSWTYSDGTLTVKAASGTVGGYFKGGTEYKLTYVTVAAASGGGSSGGGADIETTSGFNASGLTPTATDAAVSLSATSPEKYIAPGSTITLSTPLSNFGDATAYDVAVGKTFTSAAGYQEPGKATGGFSGTPTAGDTAVSAVLPAATVTVSNTTTAEDTGVSYTVPKAGTYRFKALARPSSTYSYGTGNANAYIYKNGTQAEEFAISANAFMYSADITCAAGDVIAVYAKAYKQSYNTINVTVEGLIVCVDWDNGF